MGAKYLVTGAAGHLGSHVVQELLSRGQSVRALILPQVTLPGFINENRPLLSIRVGDICDPASLDDLFADLSEPSVVIHCAGLVSISSQPDRRLYDVNVTGTANIIEQCRKHGVKRLVYVSSVHALPPSPSGQTQREVDLFDPAAVAGPYDKTKAIATQLVLDAARQGLDAVVVHPSGIIGPHHLPTGNMAQMITRYVTGKLAVAVRGGFDFVDVRDVASGIIAAAAHGRSGQCYILSNRFVEFREMFDILARMGAPRKLRLYLPLRVARAVAPFAEMYYRFTNSTPLFTRYSLETLSTNGMFSHDKASRDLGYSVRPLKETLSDTARWIRDRI